MHKNYYAWLSISTIETAPFIRKNPCVRSIYKLYIILYMSVNVHNILNYTRNPAISEATHAETATTVSGSLKYARTIATIVPTAAVTGLSVE